MPNHVPAASADLSWIPALIAATHSSEGALLVDIASFAAVSSLATGVEVTSDRVAGVVPRPFRNLRLDQAIERVGEYRLRVAGGGTHLRLDSLAWVGSAVAAVVTVSWTEDRISSSAIGFTVTRLLLRRDGSGWRLQGRELLETS